jgi:hypothetical protein
MLQHADAIGEYEIWPGRRMIDTTAEDRIQTTFELTAKIQQNRLTDMGLGEAMA